MKSPLSSSSSFEDGHNPEIWAEKLEVLFALFSDMHAATSLKVAIDSLHTAIPDIFPGFEPSIYILDIEEMRLMPYSGMQSEDDPENAFRMYFAEKAINGKTVRFTIPDSGPADREMLDKLTTKPKLLIAIPLMNKIEQISGVLVLSHPDKEKLSSMDERLLAKLESFLPQIISDQQKISEAPESIERFNKILDVGTKIAAMIELAPLLAEIGRSCSELLEAERSSVYVVDEDKDEIYTLFVQGYSTGSIRLAKSKGIAGRVFESGKTLNVEDAYNLDFFDRSWDKRSGFRTKSVLCMPMYDRHGKMIGVFQVLNKQTARRFTANDERILRTLGSFAAVAIENAKLYREQKEQFDSFIEVLAASVDAKDPTTSNHSMYVTGISVVIAKELGLELSMVEKIRIAATLHDYGKIAVPDAVLSKPAKLLPCEKYLMDFHVEKTITILSQIHWSKELRDVPLIAGTHHEEIDGGGYPLRLKGDEIPYGGRIIAVADVFHALIQARPYKKGWQPERAIALCEEMTEPHIDNRYGTRKGAHLQKDIVTALRGWLERNEWNVKLFEAESGWKKGAQLLDKQLDKRSLDTASKTHSTE